MEDKEKQHNLNQLNDNINSYIMDSRGKIRNRRTGGTAALVSPRSFIILGWIAAALTLIFSPYFAVAGITFGLLANRQAKGSGNYIIVANVALALLSIIFGLFLYVAVRRMFLGY